MSLLLDALKKAAEAKKQAGTAEATTATSALNNAAPQSQAEPQAASASSKLELSLQPVDETVEQPPIELLDEPEPEDYPPISEKADLPLLSEQKISATQTAEPAITEATADTDSLTNSVEAEDTPELSLVDEAETLSLAADEPPALSLVDDTPALETTATATATATTAAAAAATTATAAAATTDASNDNAQTKTASQQTTKPSQANAATTQATSAQTNTNPPPMPGKRKKAQRQYTFVLIILLLIVAGILGAGAAWYYYQLRIDEQAHQLMRLSRAPMIITPSSDEQEGDTASNATNSDDTFLATTATTSTGEHSTEPAPNTETQSNAASTVTTNATKTTATTVNSVTTTATASTDNLRHGQLSGTNAANGEDLQRTPPQAPPSLASVTQSHPFDSVYRTATPAAPARTVKIQRSQQPPAVEALVQEAWSALNSGDLTNARQLYRTAYQENPKQVDTLFGLAALAQLSGNQHEALNFYQQILQIDPARTEAKIAITTLGSSTPQSASYNHNESQLKQFVADKPDQPAAWFALAAHYIDKKEWALALRPIEQALALDPNHPDFLYNHAVILDQLDRVMEARNSYQLALDAAQERAAGFDLITLALYLQQLDSPKE